MQKEMSELRARFIKEAASVTDPKLLVTAVQLPSGALEVITNHEQLGSKIHDIITRYNDQFQHVHAPGVKIVGYMLL